MKILKKFEGKSFFYLRISNIRLGEQKALEAEKTDYETRNIQLKKTIESRNQIDLFAQEKDFFEQISQRPNIPEIDKFYLSNKIIQRYTSKFIFERL
jgi:hypothetical protein